MISEMDIGIGGIVADRSWWAGRRFLGDWGGFAVDLRGCCGGRRIGVSTGNALAKACA